jgi:hypothetical protein
MKHPRHLPHRNDRVTRATECVHRSMARMRQTEELLQDARLCVLEARLQLEDVRVREVLDPATNENPMKGGETR